jgi:hypothetical protein
MNSKFALLFVMVANVIALIIMSQVNSPIEQINIQNNPVLSLYNFNKQNILQTEQITLTEGFEDDVTKALTPQKGGIIEQAVSFLLDGLSMVLGVLALLTPLPILSFLFALQMPMAFYAIFSVFLVTGYILGILEFIRGASFGR